MGRRRTVSDEPIVGFPEPFERFFEREKSRVLALALALSRLPFGAEDVVQEAFLRAYRDWERVGRYDNPGAWVRRVTMNLATSRFRRLRAEAKALSRLSTNSVADELALVDDSLWNEVRRLPRGQAKVVALIYVEDLTSEQAAEVLGIGASTVRKHLSRARRTLKERIGDTA